MKPPRALLALALAAVLATEGQAFDLLQAWQAAQQHAPEAAAARAARAAGAARGDQAQALWRPQVLLEGGVSHAASETGMRGAQFAAPGFGQSQGVAFDTSITGGTSTRHALLLRQPVFDRERSANSRALGIAAEAAEIEWQQARQALMLHTAESYFGAVLAAEHLRVLQGQQAAVERAAVEARDRYRLGDRPVTEVHEATARAAALQAERLAAQTQLELRRAALADLTGLTAEAPAPALPGEPLAEDPGPLDPWLARAEQHNPALRLADARLQQAQAQAGASAAGFSPTLDVVARLARERLAGDGDFGAASNTSRQGAIGLQLAVPLYTGGLRSAQHAEHLARQQQAEAERDLTRQQAAQQTRAAWLDLATGRSRSTALDAAWQASLARLDATRVGLQAGDRTTMDLLNAENDAAAAQLALLDARVHLLVQRLRLAALAGALDDAALQQAQAELSIHRP